MTGITTRDTMSNDSRREFQKRRGTSPRRTVGTRATPYPICDEIDALVYELYGLTEQEIAIVEEEAR